MTKKITQENYFMSINQFGQSFWFALPAELLNFYELSKFNPNEFFNFF